jgi:hypothetical protein
MGERGGEADELGFFVDRRGLHSRDLVTAQGLPHDVEAARQRRVAERLILIPVAGSANGRNQRLLGVGQLSLSFRQRRCDRADRFALMFAVSSSRHKNALLARERFRMAAAEQGRRHDHQNDG